METGKFSFVRLTELFDQYVAARDKESAANDAFDGLKYPETPESINNEEDYNYFAGLLQEYKETRDRLYNERYLYQNAVLSASNAICFYIPLPNVNFKVLYFHQYFNVIQHQADNMSTWWDYEVCKDG